MNLRTCFYKGTTILALIMLPVLASGANPTITKQDKIREIMKVSNMENLGTQITQQILSSFKKTMPLVPDEVWEEIKRNINPEEVTDLIVPIYEKHFTDAEIDQLFQFYSSPIGKKLIQEQPTIAIESIGASRQWGQTKADEILQKLKEKGYEVPQQ